MRYFLIDKSNGGQYAYNSDVDVLGFLKKKFGDDSNGYFLRSLVCTCISDFTFENDLFFFKGSKVC